MAIVQTIALNTTKNYYAKFIQDIIDECKVNGYVSYENSTIYIVLDESDESKLAEFSTQINTNLPNSIFIDSIDTKETNALPPKVEIKYSDVDKNIDIKTIKSLIAKESTKSDSFEECEDSGRVYSDEIVEDGYILLLDIAKVDELFLLSPKEKATLLGYEKPIMKVAIKDESLKERLNKNFVDVKVYDNEYEFNLALKYKDSFAYIFSKGATLRVFINTDNVHLLSSNSFCSDLEDLDTNPKTNQILNIFSEFDIKKGALVFDIDNKYLDIYINKPTGLVKASSLITKVPKDIMKIIATTNGKKERLIENFQNKFPSLYTKLSNLENDLDIDEFLEIILESDTSLSDKSMEFIGNGGLKVDMKIDNEYKIDLVYLISSIISYKIAGSEASLIAFSYYESFIDILLSIADEANKKSKQDLVMIGNLLQNSVLYSRIEKKMSHFNPKISKKYTL
jgi:acylphosphatase